MTDAFKAGHLKAQADLKEGKIDYPGPGYRAFYCDGYSTAVFEHVTAKRKKLKVT